ncbi:MAG TPA: error-prone DNA polymerase [Burkholderiaceae bacterium]|nr:error-prone DNA polymerase [Burkholderiaceae bacterium]
MLAYAELDCLSNFTFLRGASHPEELVTRAAQLGYQALALADECSMSGVVRAHQEARRQGLALIIGCRFRCGPDELIVLARNHHGYSNLCELITYARLRAPKGEYRIDWADLCSQTADLARFRGLPDCLLIIKPAYDPDPERLTAILNLLTPAFRDRLWIGLELSRRHADTRHRQTLEHLAAGHQLPWVALGGVEMHLRSRQPLHDMLAAIRLKKTVADCGLDLHSNAEHHLRSRLRLHNLYPADAIKQTLTIARRCQFNLGQLAYQYPRIDLPDTLTPTDYLRQETLEGARRRYPDGIPDSVMQQLEQELSLIAKLQYEAYFLTVYDIVRHARRLGILCQGRGSAANSAVCYCLGITEVDPESSKLLFARFISCERNEPPDIDVDFEHDRREEIIQYIYRKYGRKHAALTAVVIRYRLRSALRDSGKALAMPTELIDRVCQAARHSGSRDELLAIIREQAESTRPELSWWTDLAWALRRFPRHLSQHPGGFVIARQDLSRLVPLENAAMPNRRVVQWDKDDLDAMGMLKIDVLGLGMLSVLRRCLELMPCQQGHAFRLQDIPVHDAPTFNMISQADTVGVFQIESRAQMSMLPRLQPATYYDLVIQIAIVRPGPIQGGIVHPYLERRKNPDRAHSVPAELRPILDRTLGVIVFQEQAMQVAMAAADFSADETDALRRSMAAWKSDGDLEPFRERLIGNMQKKGYSPQTAQHLYQQLQGFGSYGFPESHSASFARLAWFSAWFKRHHPAIFLTALLNSQPMGFYSISQLVQDARRHHVRVLPVSVAHSHWDNTLAAHTEETGPAVRLGFRHLKGLARKTAECIVQARLQAAFTSIHDLATRARLSQPDLERLAHANALHTLQPDRRQALWQAAQPVSHDLLNAAPIIERQTPSLAPMPGAHQTLADYQSTGLTLGDHPLVFLRKTLRDKRFETAHALAAEYPDRRLARACGLVVARQRPATAKGVIFVTLEDETGNVNAVVPRKVAEQQPTVIRQARLLGIYGVWQRQQGVCHLHARRLVDLSNLLGRLHTRSRDFH